MNRPKKPWYLQGWWEAIVIAILAILGLVILGWILVVLLFLGCHDC